MINPLLLPCTAEDDVVCWTRMQAEAGQGLEAIIRRKEVERRAGNGLFCWGVGNAPGTLPTRLSAAGIQPDVIFSVMKTPPKARDMAPVATVAWRAWVDHDGVEQPLPTHVLVTSRADDATRASRHYALICRSRKPLSLGDLGAFDPTAYRNLGGTGSPVGSSQVTALLKRVAPNDAGAYRINMRARLDGGMWVRLSDPVPLPPTATARLEQIGSMTSQGQWLDFVAEMRDAGSTGSHHSPRQLHLSWGEPPLPPFRII